MVTIAQVRMDGSCEGGGYRGWAKRPRVEVRWSVPFYLVQINKSGRDKESQLDVNYVNIVPAVGFFSFTTKLRFYVQIS